MRLTYAAVVAPVISNIPSPTPCASFVSKTDVYRTFFAECFPRSGNYRIWVQVRVAGRVLTGVFDMVVKAAN